MREEPCMKVDFLAPYKYLFFGIQKDAQKGVPFYKALVKGMASLVYAVTPFYLAATIVTNELDPTKQLEALLKMEPAAEETQEKPDLGEVLNQYHGAFPQRAVYTYEPGTFDDPNFRKRILKEV